VGWFGGIDVLVGWFGGIKYIKTGDKLTLIKLVSFCFFLYHLSVQQKFKEETCMKDFIMDLLQLKDSGELKATILPSDSSSVIIELELPLKVKACPFCGYRMYSKGVYTRTVKHPLLQDGRLLMLKLKQRKWKCDNSLCGYFETDKFSFVDKNRRITNATDFLILRDFKDYNLSARQIADRFHVTDTYVLNVFDRYVDMPRLTLPMALCIDEVHLEIFSRYKYALVLQDFVSGEPIDLVVSRKQAITEPYFANIPRVERSFVKYIISDMYAPYQNYVDTYFPNAMPVVDAFHVIKLINHKLNVYLNKLKRRYKDRDERILEERQKHYTHKLKGRESKEVYLLRTKKWLILANQDSINYNAAAFRDWHYGDAYMYISDYEKELFKLDPKLEKLRDLKEKYIRFNNKYAGDPVGAREGLNAIIKEYFNSGYQMFEEIATSLAEYKEAILNSFIMLDRMDKSGIVIHSRLSNGPMESLNRIPKDMKRHARGFSNFEHVRNRFLYATRKDAAILAYPKPLKEVKVHTGRKRGTYNKHNVPKLSQYEPQ